jgi:hypothetical protein
MGLTHSALGQKQTSRDPITTPAKCRQADILNSLLRTMHFPVRNKRFPDPIAGNSSKDVWCFNGFMQAGRGLTTEIPCIFP